MGRLPLAVTTKYTSITRTLLNEVYITQAFDPSSSPKPPTPTDVGAKKFKAIWDTGATGTVISQRVIDECGLKPTGVERVNTASQKGVLTTAYLTCIYLPNRIVIPELRVIKGIIAGGADVLIGMDIISQGDFSITNHQGKTVFSFRIPSSGTIDYVKQRTISQVPNQPRKVGRNDPCPCGSGKKYKKCCGK